MKSVPWFGVVASACALLASISCGPNCPPSGLLIVQSDLSAIAHALNNFAADHDGIYPASLSELFTKGDSAPGYLKIDSLPRDPWRREYIYAPTADRRAFKVMCFGSDGVPGGRDAAQDWSEGSTASAR